MSFGSLRQWHWISSALCLAGMLLFAITGITLNHAADIKTQASVVSIETVLPPDLLKNLQQAPPKHGLPTDLNQWIQAEIGITADSSSAQWTEDELYIAMPKPGGDAWLSLDLQTGDVLYESTDRGWIAYFNDLHKGRNTGIWWFWFIDVFAAICVIFSITGFWLLIRQANTRLSTWPITLLGFLLPLLIMLLFIH